jgi:GNAT superfamily N-acetyltransferase
VITLREASAADLDAVTAVFLRCWRGSYATVLPERVIAVFDESSAHDLWRRALVRPAPGTRGVVAVADGRVVGIVRMGSDPDEPSARHVYSLYVDPSVQGQGVGGRLLEAADAWFAAEGGHEATLWVFAANAPARRFYERHGWHPDGGSRVEAEFGEPELRLRHEVG